MTKKEIKKAFNLSNDFIFYTYKEFRKINIEDFKKDVEKSIFTIHEILKNNGNFNNFNKKLNNLTKGYFSDYSSYFKLNKNETIRISTHESTGSYRGSNHKVLDLNNHYIKDFDRYEKCSTVEEFLEIYNNDKKIIIKNDYIDEKSRLLAHAIIDENEKNLRRMKDRKDIKELGARHGEKYHEIREAIIENLYNF